MPERGYVEIIPNQRVLGEPFSTDPREVERVTKELALASKDNSLRRALSEQDAKRHFVY